MKFTAVPVTRPSTSRSTRTKAPNEYLAEIDSLIAGEFEALAITIPGGTQLVRAGKDGYNAAAASAKRMIQTAARAKKYTAETAVAANEDGSLTLTFWVKPRSGQAVEPTTDGQPTGDSQGDPETGDVEIIDGQAEIDRRALAEAPAHDAEPAHASDDDGADLLDEAPEEAHEGEYVFG